MAKDKKQQLTRELMDRLSEDGYCFDQGHAEEIKALASKVEALEKEKASTKDVIAKAVEDATAPLKQTISSRDDRIYDLEEELKKVRDDAETWKGMWESTEEKLLGSVKELEKTFRKEGRCFNILHASPFRSH